MAAANSTSIRTIITRKEAKSLGLVRYFTGKPCPHGHICERFTSYGQCFECVVLTRNNWYANNLERARLKNIAWHLENPGEKRRRNNEWRARNPEQARASTEAHRHAFPEKYVAYRANRRARKAAAPGSGITAEDILRLTESQSGRCVYCKKKTLLTLDHIVPLARGGAHDVTNAQMLCKSCNSAKCAKDPMDFAKTKGMLF